MKTKVQDPYRESKDQRSYAGEEEGLESTENKEPVQALHAEHVVTEVEGAVTLKPNTGYKREEPHSASRSRQTL